MPSNTTVPLPKKSDTPSEKVEKQVGIWMIQKSQLSLILTQLINKGNQEKNSVEEANTYPISENNNIDTVKKTDKSQTYKEKVRI